jgi:hypothetical protein
LFVNQATKQFLEEINKWTVQYNVSPLSWNVAVKFLMARKFDVLRAIELFHAYRVCGVRVRWVVVLSESFCLSTVFHTHVASVAVLPTPVKMGNIQEPCDC